MDTQVKFTNLADAVAEAIRQSMATGYAAIILSKGEYYVENSSPFIRVWEELVGQYENGKLIE